jgi:hypothetical protein
MEISEQNSFKLAAAAYVSSTGALGGLSVALIGTSAAIAGGSVMIALFNLGFVLYYVKYKGPTTALKPAQVLPHPVLPPVCKIRVVAGSALVTSSEE